LGARFHTNVLMVSTPSGAVVMADNVRGLRRACCGLVGETRRLPLFVISFTDFCDAIARVPGKRSSSGAQTRRSDQSRVT